MRLMAQLTPAPVSSTGQALALPLLGEGIASEVSLILKLVILISAKNPVIVQKKLDSSLTLRMTGWVLGECIKFSYQTSLVGRQIGTTHPSPNSPAHNLTPPPARRLALRDNRAFRCSRPVAARCRPNQTRFR